MLQQHQRDYRQKETTWSLSHNKPKTKKKLSKYDQEIRQS